MEGIRYETAFQSWVLAESRWKRCFTGCGYLSETAGLECLNHAVIHREEGSSYLLGHAQKSRKERMRQSAQTYTRLAFSSTLAQVRHFSMTGWVSDLTDKEAHNVECVSFPAQCAAEEFLFTIPTFMLIYSEHLYYRFTSFEHIFVVHLGLSW